MRTPAIKRVTQDLFLPLSAILAFFLILGGCDAGSFVEPEEPTVAEVRAIHDSHVFTAPDQTLQLSAQALDDSGDVVSGVSFDWSSTNTAVVTVSSTGIVTAMTAGTARIVVLALCCAAADTVAFTVEARELEPGTATATATAGAEQVILSATPPTGGTQPYSYQWHRSLSNGFTPAAENSIAGLTDPDDMDSGLSSGTTYYYRLVASDAAGATVTYTQVRATVQSSTNSGSLYPNEPAGMTVVGRGDGSIIENADGAFGIPDAGGWAQNDPTAISIIDDAGNPTGSGKALRFDYKVDGRPGKMDINFSAGPFTQLYVLQRIKFLSGGGWEAFNPKNFYLRVDGSSQWGANTWTDFSGHGAGGKAPGVIDGKDSNIHRFYKGNTSAALVYDQFVTLEYLFVAESAAGAGDGEVHCWVDGVLMFSQTGMHHNFYDQGPKLAGLHYYARGGEIETMSSYVLREFYVSGK